MVFRYRTYKDFGSEFVFHPVYLWGRLGLR